MEHVHPPPPKARLSSTVIHSYFFPLGYHFCEHLFLFVHVQNNTFLFQHHFAFGFWHVFLSGVDWCLASHAALRLCGASSMNSCALTSWEMMTLCPRSTCNARHCRQEEWSSLPSTAFTAGWSRPGFSKIIIFSGSRVDQASNITCHRVGDCFSGGVAGPSPNAHLWGSHGRATPPLFHKKTPGEGKKGRSRTSVTRHWCAFPHSKGRLASTQVFFYLNRW